MRWNVLKLKYLKTYLKIADNTETEELPAKKGWSPKALSWTDNKLIEREVEREMERKRENNI